MATLHFGECRRHTSHGREGLIGTYALHLQCAWRVRHGARVAVGSGDFAYPHDERVNWSDFDPDEHESRYMGRMSAWLSETVIENRMVIEVAGSQLGDLTIQFAGGGVLEAFAVDSLRDPYSERWRLLRPGTDDEHFVVSGDTEADA